MSDEPDLRRALAVSVVTHLVRLDQRQTLHADLVSCGDGGLLEAAVSRKLRWMAVARHECLFERQVARDGRRRDLPELGLIAVDEHGGTVELKQRRAHCRGLRTGSYATMLIWQLVLAAAIDHVT